MSRLLSEAESSTAPARRAATRSPRAVLSALAVPCCAKSNGSVEQPIWTDAFFCAQERSIRPLSKEIGVHRAVSRNTSLARTCRGKPPISSVDTTSLQLLRRCFFATKKEGTRSGGTSRAPAGRRCRPWRSVSIHLPRSGSVPLRQQPKEAAKGLDLTF